MSDSINLVNLMTTWTNIEPRGLQAAPGAAYSLQTGISGTPTQQKMNMVDIEVAEDGTVTCTDGWVAKVEDGWITELNR